MALQFSTPNRSGVKDLFVPDSQAFQRFAKSTAFLSG
jgi:hypothetical protein